MYRKKIAKVSAGVAVFCAAMLASLGTMRGIGRAGERQVVGVQLPKVTDGIQMTELANMLYVSGEVACGSETSDVPVASFAPDGNEFVVVVRRGDLKGNLTHYTMFLWQTRHLGTERPRVVLQMDSSSVLPAIDPGSISWAADGRSLTFLGEKPGETHQVFRLLLKTGRARALTDSPTSIISYDRDKTGSTIAYEAIPESRSLWDASTARYGLDITTQTLLDLATGQADSYADRMAQRRLLIQDDKGVRAIQPLSGSIFRGEYMRRDDRAVSISPDGRYVVVLESVPIEKVPNIWRRYPETVIQHTFSVMGKVETGNPDDSLFSRYVLVDSRTGLSRTLLNSPVIADSPVIWAPDSQSVVLSQVLIPLTADNLGQSQMDASQLRAVEVTVATGEMREVGDRCHRAAVWGADGLTCDDGNGPAEAWAKQTGAYFADAKGDSCPAPILRRLRRIGGRWRSVGQGVQAPVEILLREGMNLPPKLYYHIRGERGRRMLWDLNPQLRNLRLGEEKLVTWSWSRGNKVTAGLYYPPDYVPGRRYPLVIQTHGLIPDRFEYFGTFSTADAAQPLAGREMFVLQVDDMVFPKRYGKDGALKEVQTAMHIYKSAIQLLSVRGLIDPKRVGIVGFSHTCFYVKWALTHEPGLFAAASVEEGEDGGYLQYMMGLNDFVDVNSIYGGAPFGPNLKNWVKLSPGFNLDQVRAPTLIVVSHSTLVLLDWEWFQGLRDLGKPVYMVMLDGRAHDGHMLQEPWDELVSSRETVEWFDYWLNGREDSRVSSHAQYKRWHELRAPSGSRQAATLISRSTG